MKSVCHPSNICAGSAGESIDVVLVPFCNCRCEFCFADFAKQGHQAADIKKLLAKINGPSCRKSKSVLILGGEPLMHPRVGEFIDGIKGKEVYLTTNGSLLDAEMAKKLTGLTAINISIHHFEQEINERIFGDTAKIDFKKIRKAINILKAAGVKVRLNCLLLKGEINGLIWIDVYMRFAKLLGAEEIKFAEVQNHPELYVDAQTIFKDLPEEPFSQGCRNLWKEVDGIKIFVQRACGLVNPLKPRPENPIGRKSKTKVAWPNGKVTKGWPKTESNNTSCHPHRR